MNSRPGTNCSIITSSSNARAFSMAGASCDDSRTILRPTVRALLVGLHDHGPGRAWATSSAFAGAISQFAVGTPTERNSRFDSSLSIVTALAM